MGRTYRRNDPRSFKFKKLKIDKNSKPKKDVDSKRTWINENNQNKYEDEV